MKEEEKLGFELNRKLNFMIKVNVLSRTKKRKKRKWFDISSRVHYFLMSRGIFGLFSTTETMAK